MTAKQSGARGKGAANGDLILKALRKAKKPMSAYEIIASLRPQTDLAPPTVYRALDKLIADGSVHRLESMNAFVGCTQHVHHDDTAFAICDRCGSVTEFAAPDVAASLAHWARDNNFQLSGKTVELHGLCTSCGRAERDHA